MAPQWINELDGIPESAVEKLKDAGVFSVSDLILAWKHNETHGLTGDERQALIVAVWAQVIGKPLKVKGGE